MFTRFSKIYHEFPSKFWIVVLASFIDGIGGTLLFPFFALYITQKFGIGMTQAGILLGMSSLFSLFGGIIGGALTDKFGRKSLVLFGLVFSALSALSLGLVNNLTAMYPLIIVVGLLSSIAHPAHQAMIADLLPEEKRQEGFGILRVVGNMAWIIGPTIGGFVASRSFLALFIMDAVISCIVAVIVYVYIPETKPETAVERQGESILETLAGYWVVARDRAFMAFLGASILMLLVYQQLYNTLSVYLRDNHSINPQGYGVLLTTSAVTVILLQFWVTRRIKYRPAFFMMAFGALFYVIGYGMFGFDPLPGLQFSIPIYRWSLLLTGTFAWFMLAVVIITAGEMVVVPTSQALAANFAPEDMRGRYMAMFGFSWGVPAIIGPAAAGYVLDNYNPNLLWYICAALCMVSVFGYYFLHLRLGTQARFQPRLDEGHLPASAD